MTSENRQLSQEEILQQLPDEIRERKFSSVPIEGYTSEWQSQEESVAMMVWDKVKKNPFIPLGLGGTVYFLGKGILNMGNKRVSQQMMRGRVVAQGFTLTALLVGLFIESLQTSKNQKSE